jgi:branched-chain amino acid transport system substrate-binding protein
MITTLSTGAGYLGDDMRKGFELAIAEHDGKLGGSDIDLIVEDDGLKPESARQIATRMMESEHVDLMTGIIFSNVAMAVVPKVVRDGMIYVSTNAGPSALAGAKCDANYFNAAYQNDNIHEAMGQYVQDQGFKRVYLLAPNYPAGKDSLAGFKRYYKGDIVDEVYTKLGQTDYAAEIASLRAAKPDAVFFFYPGGMGINFIKQYAQAGLKDEIPLFGPAFSADEHLVDAVGEAAVGMKNASHWSPDMENDASKKFVAGYVAKYGAKPSLYSVQGYDAANLIGSAIAAVDGDMSKKDDFRAALKKADFTSVRGNFRFGNNNHPIQDFYVREVVADPDGGFTNKLVTKVFSNHVDAYASECKM